MSPLDRTPPNLRGLDGEEVGPVGADQRREAEGVAGVVGVAGLVEVVVVAGVEE